MRRSWLPGALALASVLIIARVPRADAPRVVERVVAVVDGEPILASELFARAAPHQRALAQRSLPAWRRASLRRRLLRNVLERLVEERLIEKAAREQAIAVTPSEIDQALAQLAAIRKLSQSELEIAIEAGGWTLFEYRRELTARLLERRLLSERTARAARWPDSAEQWDKERKRWISELTRDSYVELRLSR
jgi:peptidyl-prolyl cis-trans isomerase SurA